MSRLRQIPALILACAPLAAGDAPPASWQPAGWGGGAFQFATAWHPTDGKVLYLTSDCAGLYRSDNSAKRWEFINNGLRNYAVYCLAVSPAAPDLLYALTDGGLHKSSDRGRNWEYIADSDPKKLDICSKRDGTVRAIAIDPKNANIVYVGSRTGRLWKTSDGAKTWTELDYAAALPKPPPPPAFTGTGSARLAYDAGGGGQDPMGRISLFFGQGDKAKDWTAHKRLSARFMVPADGPALQAQLVVQSGESWKWQQGEWIEGKPGNWVEIPLDLGRISDLDSVRMSISRCAPSSPAGRGRCWSMR